MYDPPPGRWKVWTPMLAAGIMVLGMTLGYRLHDTLRNKRAVEGVLERDDRLEEMINIINAQYVDSLQVNNLYKDAVKGILSNLDPHTVYIPATDLQTANETLAGSFFGIGVEFSIVRDTIQITAVSAEGPAEEAGIEPGDRIIQVGDTVVAGKGITAERITGMLRSQEKTDVTMVLKNPFTKALRTVDVSRDEVLVSSIDAALMLDTKTGYIRIARFSESTYGDFATALNALEKQGMSQLIIDLRDNTGGYLDQAAYIADELLAGNKTIVYTKGIRSKPRDYSTQNEGLFESGRLALLINEGTASASEILAGAIQDWDRGIIIGRRSYGKGLVQEQYRLTDGSALRITVARYYTPVGRSIQRSYQAGKEAYAADYEHRRRQAASGSDADTLIKDDTVAYYTPGHRLVYGGGGIKPDVYVAHDTARISSSLVTLALSDALQSALWDYYISRHQQLLQYKAVQDFARSYNDQETILRNYLQSLSEGERLTANSILARGVNRRYLLLQLKAQLGRILFRSNGYYAISAGSDDVLQRALSILNSNQYNVFLPVVR